jgi:hypothetical protein
MTESIMGRPIEYDKSICNKAILLMKEGASLTEVAFLLDIARSTLYRWKDIYPDFSDAIKEGKAFAKGWWMNNGRININNKEFNSVLWYMNMKNRFGWKDKQESSVSVTEIKHEDAIKELE